MSEPIIVDVTPAERRLVGELALDGPGNAELADRLNVSVETVKTQMKRVLAATGVPNRTALVCALLRGQIKLRTTNRRWSALSQPGMD